MVTKIVEMHDQTIKAFYLLFGRDKLINLLRAQTRKMLPEEDTHPLFKYFARKVILLWATAVFVWTH